MKRLALFPFLFILEVILIPLARNFDQVDPSLALRPLLVLWLAAAGGILALYLLFRDWQYASYLVFLAVAGFFIFTYLNRLLQDQLAIFGREADEPALLAICAVLLGLLAFKRAWVRLGGRTWLTSYLNLAIALGLVFPVLTLLAEIVRAPYRPNLYSRQAQAMAGEMPLECSKTPDVYYIILDGYGRADSLDDLYGFNNQPFLDSLRRRGFYVADESYTNYIQTIFSIPSSLNLTFIDPPGEGVSGQAYFSKLMRHNQLMAALKRCGYTTYAIESGYSFTEHPEVDVYLRRGIGTNEFESLLLVDSPAEVLADELDLEPGELSYEAHRRRVLYSFEVLSTLNQEPGPKLVFAHIISPHPPFVFDQDGKSIEPRYGYYLGDGDDYQGSLNEYLSGYPAQVEFVNQKLEQAIDAILANSDPPPVIVIQGDHGPGSRLVWDSPSQTCLWERTPILNAYYLPEGGERLLYPSISPVNSFRVVLNAYFGAELPLLPDNTYFTSKRLPRQAVDITAERASRANCR